MKRIEVIQTNDGKQSDQPNCTKHFKHLPLYQADSSIELTKRS